MSDNVNKNQDNKGKSFYSVNLTEGRIFVIFVSLVLLFVVIFFGIFILISKISKDSNARSHTNLEGSNINNNLNFYDGSINKNDTTEDKSISKKEDSETVFEKKEESPKEGNIQQKEENISQPEIKLDDSEVLYSSKFKKVETTTTTIRPKSNNTMNKNITTNTTIKTVSKTKKYVVQVGSYVNKNTALEIESFYKKLGYPTYIQNYIKENKTYYRLRIGPFTDKKTAENYLLNLKQSKYGKNSYISVLL